jgi:hypothetical protein
MPMTDANHEGGCLCGAIRYRVSAAPRALTLCHCRSCRRAAGAPSVAWAIFPLDGFAWLSGRPSTYRSSPAVERTFCGACGTPLTYRRDTRPDTIDVTTASLDDADAFAPTREIWTAHKLAWETLSDTLPHFAQSSVATPDGD